MKKRLRWCRTAAAAALAVLLPLPARATLGQRLDSVEADRAEMQATRRVLEGTGYLVHELQAPTGTTVREYVGADGRVFGIAWQGPFIPNLRQLLGSYFEAYSQAAQDPRTRRPGHGPLLVSLPQLVVESAGHPRAFYGRAYLPSLVPAAAIEEGIR
jgi:hypothetical protein